MKKLILLSLMVLYINLAKSQDCNNDINRIARYEYMEVYNYTTKVYEKFTGTDTIEMSVSVHSKEKSIFFKDPVNNYNKEFYILNCSVKEDFLIYDCLDLSNNKKCYLLFSSSQYTYFLIVKYFSESVMYKLKNVKQ